MHRHVSKKVARKRVREPILEEDRTANAVSSTIPTNDVPPSSQDLVTRSTTKLVETWGPFQGRLLVQELIYAHCVFSLLLQLNL